MSDTSATPPAPATPSAATPPPATPPAAPATPPSNDDHYVAQKDVDRIVGERLGREREKLERESAAKIEAAKVEGRTAATQELLSKSVDTTAKSIARELGFHDTADALAAIERGDKLPVKDNEPDEVAIKASLEKLAKDKPYLVKTDVERRTTTPATGRPKLPAGNVDKDAPPAKMKAAEALRALRGQSRHVSG